MDFEERVSDMENKIAALHIENQALLARVTFLESLVLAKSDSRSQESELVYGQKFSFESELR